ncbi:MAG: CheR family methyltransferase [Planctomycetota bacterium]
MKTAGRPKGAESEYSAVDSKGTDGGCGLVDLKPGDPGPKGWARGNTTVAIAEGFEEIGSLCAAKPRRGLLRRLFFRKGILCDVLMYPYARLAHRRVLSSGRRSQSHIYTSFHRSPHQLEALTSHVIPFIGRGMPPRNLSINVVACSTGAEPYTVTSELIAKFPELDFNVWASDLHEDTVARAKAAHYTSAEVFLNDDIPDEFVIRTFDRAGDYHVVKPEIRERVSFTRANLLDPTLATRFEPADIVFAQNVFFHLDPADAVIAFDNMLGLLKDRSALFIDGMELDMKEWMTTKAGLTPLGYKCREIYSHARRHSPARWWKYYYGAEPYLVFRRGRQRRYGTIFLRDAEPQASSLSRSPSQELQSA